MRITLVTLIFLFLAGCSLPYLKKDTEILWVQGKEKEALKIWESSLNRHPSNTVLLETTARFK
jgi:hypothetical protein